MANKAVLWNCVALLFIIVISHTSSASAFKFEHKVYAFAVTQDRGKGVIGYVKVQPPSPNVEFSFVGSSSPLQVNNHTGKVRLAKKLRSDMEMNTKFTIRAKKGHHGVEDRAKVHLIVLRDDVIREFARQAEQEEKIALLRASAQGNAETSERTSQKIFRQLGRLPSDFRADSRTQVMAERVVSKTKSKVANFLAKLCPPDAKIINLVSVNDLLPKEDECKEQIEPSCPPIASKYRTMNGSCNNRVHPLFGASNTAFIRLVPARYYDKDGINDPIGYPGQREYPDIPSPLNVSSDFIIDEVRVNAMNRNSKLTHAVMQFGQFLNHGLTLTANAEDNGKCDNIENCDPDKPMEIPCYPIRTPKDSKAKCIRVTRSAAACQNGKSGVRQQLNTITAFIDLSQVYGSGQNLANRLRNLSGGMGLLKARQRPHGDVLTENTNTTTPCVGEDGCYLAGDTRVNQQAALASIQTLFFREHNRIARELKKQNKDCDGETIYQETRHILGGVMQKIVYEDYLPKILGAGALSDYTGYDKTVNPGIANAFAAAAFRFGHSQIRPKFDVLDNTFQPIYQSLDLRYLYFNNSMITKRGISPFLLGLVGDEVQNVDRGLASGVVDHVYATEHDGGSNLAAINIQRSRDHGLPSYNEYRKFCNLPSAHTFHDTANEIKGWKNRKILSKLYHDNPDNVELWVAGLAETPVAGGSVGRTFQCIIKDQFERTRDGDRYFYKNDGVFTDDQLIEINKASLARMYCDNLNINKIQPDVFDAKQEKVHCDDIDHMDLIKWKKKDPAVTL